MSLVLRIDADGGAALVPWPADALESGLLIRAGVGGSVDTAVYHRRAVLHVHGNGQAERLPLNLSAWVLASVWRGIELPYGFYGTVMVTGPRSEALGADLVEEVQTVCAAVAEVRAEWQDRPPVGENAARAELLATGRHARDALRAPMA
ncbi:hypothetical protein EES41_36230 [Streptomyces sp. ADI95-16]|uniref:hypothetical protein n=1 Tax=Streptomyces sp. ADI95-16 TaxID=1522758 RepID=UPI000F3A8046|nr:hypothetical protein [Streptomyces sp. ADI95-16]AYV32207.1 hypothetical protein EES41_36230 [Streptomyces sp. ADI95-16]